MIAGCNERGVIMDIKEKMYNGEFTVEERKAMTAQVLHELRKSKKLSQKEVAGELNIPATTYNTYESGRTEPPIEILVRLSHLYGVPVDFIVQRDRTFRTADDMNRQITAYKDQLAEVDKIMAEGNIDNPLAAGLLDMLGKLTDAMASYSQTEAVKNALDKK